MTNEGASASAPPGRWNAVVVTAGLSTATVAAGLVVWMTWRHGFAPNRSSHRFPAVAMLDLLSFYAFALVGAVLARRRAGNVVGWLLLVIGAALTAQEALNQYASHAYSSPPVAAGATVADWMATWFWLVGFGPLPLLALRFPDGRLTSRPSRWVHRLAVGSVGGMLLLVPALTWRDRNPVIRLFEQPDEGAVLVVVVALVPLFLLSLAAAGVHLVVRFRRSRGLERQQLRWAAAAGVGFVAFLVVGALADFTGSAPLQLVTEVGGGLAFGALPVAIGVAVARYRLYELDRIISRTVSYALITLTLVGIYISGVLGLGAAVTGITGGAGGDLVVAGSTLLVAAAFGPVRRRVQSAVDHRFDRARYDAQRTVDAFVAQLRGEVDLQALAGELARVARVALAPREARVWIHEREMAP